MPKYCYYTSREDICGLTPPNETKSYAPVSHEYLITQIMNNINEHDLMLRNEEYRIDKWGNKLTGVFQFDDPNNEYGLQLAIINSYDKSRSVASAIGGNVFVCMNGMITGEHVFKRKHTGNVLIEIKDHIKLSFDKMLIERANLDEFIETSKKYKMSRNLVYDILGEFFIERNLLNTPQLNIVKKGLNEGSKGFKKLEDCISSWDLYNHITEALKTCNSNDYVKKHIELHTYFSDLI